MSRCIPIVLEHGTAENDDQAVALCHSLWKQEREKMSEPHEVLLERIRSRSEKKTEFNYGILTADRYVKTFQDVIGLQACYKHMCRTDDGGWASFDDALRKAAGTLTYSVPEMEVKKKRAELPSGVQAPKNTLMVFRHVLTTDRKDRDGDILRTKGAKIDPKMLLLWQHVHTMPIGKMLKIASHTDNELQLYSCIVDMNELCHDAAVMVDNDMGRFSHGFRALDFLEIKARENEAPGGYDVKKFEILEESLVSVPANPDSETQEVLVSLVEGGKLTSGVMKECASVFRKRMPTSVPVEVDLKIMVNGQEVKNANESRDEEGGEGDEPGPSKEAEAVSTEAKEVEGTEDAEVTEENKGKQDFGNPPEVVDEEPPKKKPPKKKPKKEEEDEEGDKALADDSQSGGSEAAPPVAENEEEEKEGRMVCPECDYVGPGKDGACPECGAKLTPRKDFIIEKLGRVLSKANESRLRDAVDDLDEAGKMEIPRGCRALIGQAKRSISEALSSLGMEEGKDVEECNVKEAMAIVVAKAGRKELSVLKSLLEAFEHQEEESRRAKQFSDLIT